jgi:hypothetical protein
VPAPRKTLKLANRAHRFALAAAEQAFVDAGLRPTADTANRWGCAVGAAMMTSDYVDLAATHDHSAANGDVDYGLMLSDPAANDPMAFCRSQATAGVALLTRQHDPRLCDVGYACASGDRRSAPRSSFAAARSTTPSGGYDSMISPSASPASACSPLSRQRHAGARGPPVRPRATASCWARARAVVLEE